MERRDDAAGIVDAERGLGDVSDGRVGRNLELADIGFGLHQRHRLGDLAHGAFDLGVAGMADENELAALADIALALIMDLGDQGAGRVEDRQRAGGGFFLDAFCHPMGAEDGDRIGRHFGQVLDEARAFGLQALHHVLIVHDLVAHIDRRAVFLQRPFDDLDGAHHTGAKSTRLGEYNFHQDLPVQRPVTEKPGKRQEGHR